MRDQPRRFTSADLAATATQVAAGYAVAGGAITLLGWAADLPNLTDWGGTGISMFPNTAVCAVISGVLLLVRSRRTRWPVPTQIAAVFVALIGALTLFQHVTGISLGIDTVLGQRSWGQRAAAAPMRMGPPASTSYVLLGVALLLLAHGPRARRLATAFGAVAAAIATLALTGYLYGADPMFKLPRYTGIAMQTASILLALAIGVICAAPEQPPFRTLLGDRSAAMIARRTLPVILILPLVFGWLRVWGQAHGLFDTGMGTALLVMSLIICMLVLLGWATTTIEKRESERLLVEEELREADRRKDEFLAVLAHELRNPLAPIRNAVQVMRLDAGGLSNTGRMAIDMMDRQVHQMVRLIDDLLDVSRISQGKIHLRQERLSLAAVARQSVDVARPLFASMGQDLTLAAPEDPIEMNGDPARLSQIVGNLLNNASKFTPRGGHARLSVAREGEDAVLRVRDDGIGIAPDQLARIFEPFAQVDTSLARTHGGLGIGLTLVKTLVEMHGGRVEARSEGAGRGSEFVVRLPVRSAAGGPAASHPDTRAIIAPRRILIVDDNRDSARSLALLMTLGGHDVHLAHDGLEAVAAADRYEPDVVLLDIGLPGLDGYQVARRIRERAARPPVLVAITGWGQEKDRRRAEDAGFDAHMVKPVDHQLLGTLLSRAPVRPRTQERGANGSASD